MKIYLFKTQNIQQKHLDSLNVALMFAQGSIEILSDYHIKTDREETTTLNYSTEQLLQRLEMETDPVLVAHSETIFAADALSDIQGSYHHFSQQFGKVSIQLPIHTAMLVNPRPTIPFYGGRKLWLTGDQLFTNDENPIPVAFGDPEIFVKCIKRTPLNNPAFHNQIFHGGDTLLLTAFPPLAFDMRFEEIPAFSAATLDQKTYIESIPSLSKE